MLFLRLIGIVPLGIGVTTLGFLWLSPWNEFGSPPLFFRVFGSFVALGFILTGLAALAGNALGRHQKLFDLVEEQIRSQLTSKANARDSDLPPLSGYLCRYCNSPLGRNADVSPLGDVKCEHCGKWFNIHGKST